MPRRDWTLRLRDMLASVDKILRYTEGMTRDQFGVDERTVDAVVRNLTVIGEAARQVPPEVVARHPGLPWTEMGDMRNVVVHQYFGVDLDVLWDTVKRDLPPVRDALRRIVTEGSPAPDE